MFLVVSYPRSGNHLVRFFIEYITGRATLGCADNPLDTPIAADEFDTPDVLAHVDQTRPIAHKAHTVTELRGLLETGPAQGLIVICREPIEALLAHVDRPRRDFAHIRFRRRLRENVHDYLEVLRFYAAAATPKLLLRYEDWVTEDSTLFRRELDRLAGFLGDAVVPERLAEAKARYGELRRLSANPRRRMWKGFRSNGERRFHQLSMPADLVAIAQREASPLTEVLARLSGSSEPDPRSFELVA